MDYRLYIANESGQYENIPIKNVKRMLDILDYCILDKQYHTKYLVIHTINGGDTAEYLSFGDIPDYLNYKEQFRYRKEKKLVK